MKEYISNSLKDTRKIAKEFANEISAGDIVLLRGDLGAGKTAFVKAIVWALGGKQDSVTSPTFTIVNEYLVNSKTIYHFDLYRINDINELYNIGIEEYLYSNGVCFIEWPERAEEIFVGSHYEVEIKKIGETSRKFIIRKE